MVGVAPERVVLLRAGLPEGRSVGSGTLVAASLVLTAAHVVFDPAAPGVLGTSAAIAVVLP